MDLFVGIRELCTMTDGELGLVVDAAIGVSDGRVVWVGPRREAPDGKVKDLGQSVVVPGLVDPHTHLVFAGDRVADFEARCRGETYAQIAARGGGIQTTVAATRKASGALLEELARPRLEALSRAGVTTVEVKSGYGLTVEDELKQLEVVRRLSRYAPQRLIPTLLLHIVPREFREARAAWVSIVCGELLPRVRREGLADAVDVFCDVGAFTRDEALEILRAAKALGFGLKAHCDQLSATGLGAEAARLGALSLEHLEHADDETIAAMASAGTVAVLLPGASVFLGDAARPPVAAFRAAGVPMALASDLNPGSSPTYDPWLVATLACTQYGLTPIEALRALTVNAAKALGLTDGQGTIAVGGPADFVVARAQITDWRQLVYGLGHRPVAMRYVAGRVPQT